MAPEELRASVAELHKDLSGYAAGGYGEDAAAEVEAEHDAIRRVQVAIQKLHAVWYPYPAVPPD